MADWKERGKITMLWTGVVCLVAVSFCICFLLLQGREMEATGSESLVSVAADVHDLHEELIPAVQKLPGVIDDAHTLLTTTNSQVATVGGSLNRAINLNSGNADLFFHRVTDDCPTPADIAAGSKARCGVVENINSTLGTFRGTAGVFEVATRTFTQHEGALYDQENDLYTHASRSLTSFDDLMSNPSWQTTLNNFAAITGTGAHMLYTADKVEDKMASCTLTPHFTCYAKSSLLFGAQVGGALLH